MLMSSESLDPKNVGIAMDLIVLSMLNEVGTILI